MNWFWELPQSLLGAVILLFLKEKEFVDFFGRKIVWFKKGKVFSGTSLGYWILLPKSLSGDIKTRNHEYGHCLQSAKWSWLYLFVIGIPSIISNIRSRFDKEFAKTYYSRYPEKEADWLGGVIRD